MKQGLTLSRQRVLTQLQLDLHPRHRQMLNQALADLDRRLEEPAADQHSSKQPAVIP
jgi:hypothetical protein